MENEKKVYETPEVTKVEFDASDRITASSCDSSAADGNQHDENRRVRRGRVLGIRTAEDSGSLSDSGRGDSLSGGRHTGERHRH